jgi:hypothetical protein
MTATIIFMARLPSYGLGLQARPATAPRGFRISAPDTRRLMNRRRPTRGVGPPQAAATPGANTRTRARLPRGLTAKVCLTASIRIKPAKPRPHPRPDLLESLGPAGRPADRRDIERAGPAGGLQLGLAHQGLQLGAAEGPAMAEGRALGPGPHAVARGDGDDQPAGRRHHPPDLAQQAAGSSAFLQGMDGQDPVEHGVGEAAGRSLRPGGEVAGRRWARPRRPAGPAWRPPPGGRAAFDRGRAWRSRGQHVQAASVAPGLLDLAGQHVAGRAPSGLA